MARNMEIEIALCQAVEYARTFLHTGKVASYIPELAKGNPEQLGACIVTADGTRYRCGDWQQEFTIQSISKTINLIYALQNSGYTKVFSKVGMEPTGDAFNSIIKLETKTVYPLNPMINAGAIAVAGCNMNQSDPFGGFLALTRRLCGRDSITLNEAVYHSENRTGMRNRAMAYMMQSENVLEYGAEEVLDLYFRMCSVNVNTEDLAHFGLILSNHGVDPVSGEMLVEGWIVQIVKTLMFTCGLYDGSGEFAVKVGIASKSGVGGGIVGAVEQQMGIAAFGPALDAKGNSVGGYHVFEYLSHCLNLHCFGGTSAK